MANMNIRMDDETKKQAEVLFAELGMNMTTAINVFLRQAIREKGIPFEVKIDEPNSVTVAAIEEGRKLVKDKTVKGYQNMASLKSALEE